ncbi:MULTISPECIES: FecCD family ABC transporter permease [Methylosinus]|uniref:Iron ABC transporter permease n=1 Tax=Methylosinus trichosporium (strain ATCC 35070 / NCIMB 11131 / UNIQEM 75 / OB3b) TaxID=595536 RepID=A0A2D2D6T9_METT3|nr:MULTISPECIES: iron ABC transporter permease [Methylosinus]ATQ70718.1 iron ABC transporter permease [Methylosinus trichosporium OB3b]OBS50765.1 ABC transporter permease [Methylosinus sp. 3S-1]
MLRKLGADHVPVLLFVAIVLLMLFSLTLGRYPVPFADVARIVFTTFPINAVGDYENAPWVVVEIVRMPRILLVTLCGMGLALSGAAMQGVFRNPLVGPEVAGVSSGAELGGVAAIMLSWPPLAIVGMAFASGLAALAAAFALARLAGRASTLALVLSGVIVGGFCCSLVGLLQTLADPMVKLPSIVYWLLGSFAGATYEKVAIVAGVTLFAGTALLALRWRVNLLSLGNTDAAALGVDVEALRWGLMGLVALLVAAQVSVSGGVGWVGLVVPHLARMLVGPEHTRLLPTSAFLGGIYLLAMDDIARGATEQEIPIGLLTSAVGTPVFAFLFWKTQSKGWMRE